MCTQCLLPMSMSSQPGTAGCFFLVSALSFVLSTTCTSSSSSSSLMTTKLPLSSRSTHAVSLCGSWHCNVIYSFVPVNYSPQSWQFSTISRHRSVCIEAVWQKGKLTTNIGSSTSFNWLNIAARAASVTVSPPSPASALTWAQAADADADAPAELLAFLHSVASPCSDILLFNWALYNHLWNTFETVWINWSNFWSMSASRSCEGSCFVIGSQLPAKLCTVWCEPRR